MIISTKAIVLRKINYSDSSLIVDVFTELEGRKSFFIKGILGKKKQNLKIHISNLYHKFRLNTIKEKRKKLIF